MYKWIKVDSTSKLIIKTSDSLTEDCTIHAVLPDDFYDDWAKYIYDNYKVSLNLNRIKREYLSINSSNYTKRFTSGITYNNVLYDFDTLAVTRILGKMTDIEINDSDSITWFDFNYNPVEMSKEEVFKLFSAITDLTMKIEVRNCTNNTVLTNDDATEEDLTSLTLTYEDLV
jgi:hypothetical protein